MATEDVYATPPPVPGELEGGNGTETEPFHSVTKAMNKARNNGGGVVHLHGGHYVESVRLDDFGQSGAQMVVQPVGDGEVFIDGMLSEFVAPKDPEQDRWDPVIADDGEFHGEYVWLRPYDGAPITGGAFLDEPVHTRLVSYSHREDLTATGEVWPDNAVTGNRVWRLHPDQLNFKDRYKPEDRDPPRFPRWRPWVYMGPGIWFDADTPNNAGSRRVHIRLAPTSNNIPGWRDYDPETTDANQVRLALSRESQFALFLSNSQHVTFENLTLRFGHPETVRLRNCSDIVFDHCRIRSGSRAVTVNADTEVNEVCKDISIQHCEIDGGIPTWFFRSDRKDQYLFAPEPEDPATTLTRGQLGLDTLGHATSGVQLSGTAGCVGVTVHHCEIFNAHDSYVFGEEMKFHHNWVHNLNDDGIAMSALAETKNAQIYSNVMTQCLTALSFAGGEKVGPVHIYGNLFDIREPTLGKRPTGEGAPDSLRQGHFIKQRGNERHIFLFHNTCLVFDPGAKGDDLTDLTKAGFAYYSDVGTSEPRPAYNNIFVAAYTPTEDLKPIAFLPPDGFGPTEGNTYLRIPAGDAADDNFIVRVGNPDDGSFPDLDTYQERYWPNDEAHEYEHHGQLGDPGFKSFDTATGRPHGGDDLRLRFHPESPAKGTAVDMPQELTDMYVEATGTVPADRGCYPITGARLQVGVDGRLVFPWIRPHLGPETHPDGALPLIRHGG
jgi:hypothetical protein